MRVADYIFQTLADRGTKHVFLVTGGGAMHLNDALRREMGEKLYQKASTQFSIQHTVDTQLHIYREILRRHRRHRRRNYLPTMD